MLKIDATIKTSKWVEKLLTQYGSSSPVIEATQEAATSVAKEWKRIATRNASAGTGKTTLSRRSDGLVKSIAYRTTKTDKGLEIRLLASNVGAYQEYGAIITPKRAPYLVFFIPGVGWRKSKRVILPARPWASSAWNEARPEFPEFLRKQLQKEMDANAAIVNLKQH